MGHQGLIQEEGFHQRETGRVNVTRWEPVQTKRHLRGRRPASAKDSSLWLSASHPVASSVWWSHSFLYGVHSTRLSTTVENIEEIRRYCFVNRADTLDWYWGYGTWTESILLLLCLCTTRAMIPKASFRSPLKCGYANIFWALGCR